MNHADLFQNNFYNHWELQEEKELVKKKKEENLTKWAKWTIVSYTMCAALCMFCLMVGNKIIIKKTYVYILSYDIECFKITY